MQHHSSDDSSFVLVSARLEEDSRQLSVLQYRSPSATPMSDMFEDLMPMDPSTLLTHRSDESPQTSWVKYRGPSPAVAVVPINLQMTSNGGSCVTNPLTVSSATAEAPSPPDSSRVAYVSSTVAQFAHFSSAPVQDSIPASPNAAESPAAEQQEVCGYYSNALNASLGVGVFMVFATPLRCQKVERMMGLDPTTPEAYF